MRVAFYNQMFGLDGRSALAVGLAHLTMFRDRDPERIERKARVRWTVRTLIKAKADVLAVAEVLPGQREEFTSRLNSLGYGSVLFFSRTNAGRPAVQDLLVASRTPAETRPTRDFPVNDEFSGGGGLVHCYLPSAGTHVMAVHLARTGNGLHGLQVRYIQDRLAGLDGPVVLMGDFNDDQTHVKDDFPGLAVLTRGIKTCSIVPLIKLFYFKDLDHILARGWRAKWVGKKRDKSDHRLVYADLVKEIL